VVGDLRAPNMLGIDARTGYLKWITQVHPDRTGIMTGSPVLAGDTIFTGVSAAGASGPGATFRGAIVALNAQTGRILWRSYSLPDNGGIPGGYAGATMFSPPAVDLPAGLVYGTFGQPYTEPASVTACHAAHGGFTESCEQPGSFLKCVVYTLLDAKTGEFIWNTLVGPGGDQGGMEWGTAFDGNRIYASITNHHHIPYKLTENGVITNTTVTGGSWAALDPITGTILWQTPDPQVETLPGVGVVGVWDLAPVTVANGVVYAASMAKLASQDQMF